MALTDNLIAYWNLDEASGNAIDAHGANDLVPGGGATVGQGVGPGGVGNARDFEAGDVEYLQIADNADLSFGDEDFTFAIWVKLEDKSAHREVFGKWANPSYEYGLTYLTGTDRFRFSVGGGGDSVLANTFGSPTVATWYLVVCWHDAVNNQLGISVNGSTETPTSFSGGPGDGTSPFCMGNSFDAGSTPFDGLLAKCGLWGRVLTSGERTTLYNSGTGLSYADITGPPPPSTGAAFPRWRSMRR